MYGLGELGTDGGGFGSRQIDSNYLASKYGKRFVAISLFVLDL